MRSAQKGNYLSYETTKVINEQTLECVATGLPLSMEVLPFFHVTVRTFFLASLPLGLARRNRGALHLFIQLTGPP